jgi:biotin synthase
MRQLSCNDAIRTIAIFRIILKDKIIKIAAGREAVLSDFQALGFLAGANGMLIGGYLTIRGRDVEKDLKLVEEVKRLWQE